MIIYIDVLVFFIKVHTSFIVDQSKEHLARIKESDKEINYYLIFN